MVTVAPVPPAAPSGGPPAGPGHRARRRPPASLDWLRAALVARRPRFVTGPRAPVLVLAAAMGAWFALFAVLVVRRHDHFGTFDHDLGIWDQAVWLLANGHSLITVRGLPVFGFHASPALYLYVPFYRLGAGANFLNVSMVGAVCLGALPLYRAARHHLRNEWHALVPAIAFLVNFAAQWMLQETFHPEVIAITPLLFAYLAALEGRWRAYALWVVFALAWKEDVALAALMLGVVLALRGQRTLHGGEGPAGTRRAGVVTIVACAGWFLFATRVLIPSMSVGGNFTEALFGDLGSTPGEIAVTTVTRPDIVGEHLAQSDPVAYLVELTGSFGFVGLLSPLPLLIGLPQAAINLLAVYNFFWTTKVHYAAMPLLGTAIASAEGAARLRWLPVRRFLLGAMAVGAFFTAASWGLSPLSPQYRSGYWIHAPGADHALLETAVSLPAAQDPVSAAYHLVPHLAHRQEIYTFPNPWLPTNWGVDGENRPDPRRVEWIMVDPEALGDHDRGVLAHALTDPDRLLEPDARPDPLPPELLAEIADPRHWTVVMDEPTLLVVRRTGS